MRAHRFQRLCTCINLLCTDIFLHCAINFSGTKNAPILGEDFCFVNGLHLISSTKTIPILGKSLFFILHLILGSNTISILGEDFFLSSSNLQILIISKKVRTHQNFCAHRLQKIRGRIGCNLGLVQATVCGFN